jgi:hypothetical protein
MAKYRKVDPRIWNDSKFRDLSDNGKLVFFMLLTHPSMTALGAMRASLAGLAEEMGWAPEGFSKAFVEALDKGMVEHDRKACLIALPKFIFYNKPESPNVVKAWSLSLDLLPECNLKNSVIMRARRHVEGLSEGFAKALPKTFLKTMPYQEQEQEQEQDIHKNIPSDKSEGVPGQKKSADPVKPEKSKYKFTQEQHQLAIEMSCPVKQRHPKAKINWDEWAEAVRLLVEIDGYTLDQIRQLWMWSRNYRGQNGFRWADGCRTAMKLRMRKEGLQYIEIIKTQMLGEVNHASNQSGQTAGASKPSLVERVQANSDARAAERERQARERAERTIDGEFMAEDDGNVRT